MKLNRRLKGRAKKQSLIGVKRSADLYLSTDMSGSQALSECVPIRDSKVWVAGGCWHLLPTEMRIPHTWKDNHIKVRLTIEVIDES